MRAWMMTLLLVAVAVAGCSDGKSGPSETTDDPFTSVNVKATDSTGVIKGIVVDEAIRPVSGAQIEVIVPGADPLSGTSTADGAFGFQGLEPGSYFLTVSKLGYFSVQSNVDVVAGIDNPAPERILLQTDAASRPYYQVNTFSGYLECSARVIVPGVLSYGSNTGCNELDNQETAFVVEFPQQPTFFQGEMTWESSQSTGTGLSLVVGPSDCRDIKWGRKDGVSPAVVSVNATVIEQNLEDGSDAGTCYRVFSWSAPDTQNTAGAAVQQEFQIIVHSFFNFEPEPGWTFGTDGNPRVPE